MAAERLTRDPPWIAFREHVLGRLERIDRHRLPAWDGEDMDRCATVCPVCQAPPGEYLSIEFDGERAWVHCTRGCQPDEIAAALALDLDNTGWLIPRAAGPPPPRSLNEVLDAFSHWLYIPDPNALLAVLGTIAANLLDGDPVWLVLVAAPSSGKSELLAPVTTLPYVHPVATITEAGLLSGTPRKERAADARGGLLRAVGGRGLILCKDLGSILDMERGERSRVLAALREVYDGSWTRRVGAEGGRTLHWEGHCGLVAGATPKLDRHHGVMSSMGERFLLFRPHLSDADLQEATRFSLRRGREAGRDELREAIAGLFAEDLAEPAPLAEVEQDELVTLSSLVARARSAVERDGYSREIELIPDSEAPSRLALALAQLHYGLRAIGVELAPARAIVHKAALDCIPTLRRRALEHLADEGTLDTGDIARALHHPTSTMRRALEDLEGHGLLARQNGGQGHADAWSIHGGAGDLFRSVNTPLLRNRNHEQQHIGGTP